MSPPSLIAARATSGSSLWQTPGTRSHALGGVPSPAPHLRNHAIF